MNNAETESRTSRLKAVHFLVIALSLTMTIGVYAYSRMQAHQQLEARFEFARDQTVRLIRDRMSRYEEALWSGVALADTLDGNVAHGDWHTFATSLRIEEKYPGVNGIGVIFRVDREDVPAFLEAQDRAGRPIEIYPEHSFETLLPITYLEPEEANRRAIGLDVAHEENRRTALLASVDSGTAQITAPIVLVQDSGHTAGFLFYTPFYHGPEPQTIADRRARFAGVVYAPFVVRKLVQGLLAQDLRHVDFSIRDGDEVIYDEHGGDGAVPAAEPLFSDKVEIDMYGRRWVVDIRTNASFLAQNVTLQPLIVLLGGLIIEGLIIAMLIVLVRANRTARAYAEDLTRELRQKSDHLVQANEEIERFVYVAAHDLKTPARGIGFLTDCIEEDLERLVGNLDHQPELKDQLQMIRGRVERMHDLTNGIMTLFSASAEETGPETGLSVGDLVRDCLADFDLEPWQIACETDVEEVTFDASNFRRVCENLIGNAVKYHPDKARALVSLRIERRESRLWVSISDNGRGISPQHHDKIFEVFQTLRRPGDPESTGIGLSIVKKVVERHLGSIGVTSDEGAGATFVFDWPIAGAEAAPLASRAA